MRFENKVTIITGAASGLGRAAARLFGTEGARLILIDHDGAKLSKVVSELEAMQVRAHSIVGDVGLADTAERSMKAASSLFGGLHILVNNAGINPVGSLVDTDETTWDRVMAVNLKAPYLFAHRGIPLMVSGGGGVIVNIASTAATRASSREAAYGISKAGLVHLTRTVARDFAAQGIRAVAVNAGYLPSVTQDRLLNTTDEQLRARHERAAGIIPMGRECSYEECARVVAFLASEDASYITGSAVVVDGGFTA